MRRKLRKSCRPSKMQTFFTARCACGLCDCTCVCKGATGVQTDMRKFQYRKDPPDVDYSVDYGRYVG